MTGPKKIPFQERWIIFLVFTGVFFIYFYLQGYQGTATHVITYGKYALVSMGDYGKAIIYEIRRTRPLPQNLPFPINPNIKFRRISKPLDKSALHHPMNLSQITIPSGNVTQFVRSKNWLFAIDPNYGIYIFDAVDPQNPLYLTKLEFYGIHDFKTFDDLGFIAAGRNGIYLLDLRDPIHPTVLDHYDTPGIAESIIPASLTIHTVSIQNPSQPETKTEVIQQRFMAYVADGENGLILVDCISNLPEISRFNVINRIATNGYAKDVFIENNFIFLAIQSGGVYVYDTLSGGDDPTHPRPLGILDTPDEILQVIFNKDRVYVAMGAQGLSVSKQINLGGSVQFEPIYTLEIPGGVNNIAINKDLGLITSGVYGTYLYNLGSPNRPISLANFPTPGLATIWQIMDYLFNPDQNKEKISASLLDMAKELSFSGILFIFWLIFLSPFAMPYSIILEFWRSAGDFLKHLLGTMGSAVMVENGQLLADPAMQNYTKYRPLILDNASAGLIAGQDGATRVIGPGTDQLQPGEALIKAADLRSNTLIYGPADEDPFLPQQPSEDETMFRQRLQRRVQTAAFTRDGVEISPNIIVEFCVKNQPNPPRNPFGFQSAYASQALRQDYAMDKSIVDSEIDSDLNRLPADLAVQAWRTSLKLYDLDTLFSPLDMQDPQKFPGENFGLQQIVGYVNRCLTNQYVEEISDNGKRTGNLILNESYNELEYAGLVVKRAWIVNLHIDPDSEADFIRRWISHWPAQINKEKANLDARYLEVEGLKHQQAVIDFVDQSNKPLIEGMQRYRTLPEQFLSLNRSLHLLVMGTRLLNGLPTVDLLKLDQIIDWLERRLEN